MRRPGEAGRDGADQRHVDLVAAVLTVAVWAGDLGEELDQSTIVGTWKSLRNEVALVLAEDDA